MRFKGGSSRESLDWGHETGHSQPWASLSLFVNEGVELAELQGPGRRMLWDSLLKSVSTQLIRLGPTKLPYHFSQQCKVVLTYLSAAV